MGNGHASGPFCPPSNVGESPDGMAGAQMLGDKWKELEGLKYQAEMSGFLSDKREASKALRR